MYRPLPPLLASLLLTCTLSVPAFSSNHFTKRDAPRPNIVLIMSDDMGISDIGCYGSEVKTPVLDKLAEGGVRFKQFYNTGRCCPTRAALLTGLYSHQAGIGHMLSDKGYDGYRGELAQNSVTIAEALQPTGYSTYMIGKWHVTTNIRDTSYQYNWPLQRGFDKFYGMVIGAASFYDPASLTRGNKNISPDNDPKYKPETYYFTTAITDNTPQLDPKELWADWGEGQIFPMDPRPGAPVITPKNFPGFKPKKTEDN